MKKILILLPHTFAANYTLTSDGFSYSFAQICSYKHSFAHPIKATLPELKCHISVKSKISIK